MDTFQIERRSRTVVEETKAKFKGVWKISTSALVFFPDFTIAEQSLERDKVDRLKRVMRREGCDRENPNHMIVGDIDPTVLTAALGRLTGREDNGQTPRKLYLPPGQVVRCAYGRSRVRALEEINGADYWWTIQLYTGKLPCS